MMSTLRTSIGNMADTILSRSSTAPPYNQMYLDSDDDFKDAVNSWECGLRDTISYTSNGKTVLAPGTCPGGPNVGKPFFQFLPLNKKFEQGGTLVCESENCISFIPAGFRNASTPNTMNPVREDIGGTTALMSLVHVLTIPKTTRIYNSATLKPEHKALIQEMKELGEQAVKILMESGEEQLGSLVWVYKQDGAIQMNDGQVKSVKVQTSDLSPACRKNYGIILNKYTTLNSFHLYPAASIGWLHLHSYVGDLLTTAHDTMETEASTKGYRKNTDYDFVYKNIR
jgi:hypothetical protein